MIFFFFSFLYEFPILFIIFLTSVSISSMLFVLLFLCYSVCKDGEENDFRSRRIEVINTIYVFFSHKVRKTYLESEGIFPYFSPGDYLRQILLHNQALPLNIKIINLLKFLHFYLIFLIFFICLITLIIKVINLL